ncbi:hypothetical protein [Nostoc sp. DedQUE09]|uniref:hypothetical protein n=1 Tax=Nostoc sp. DedQUE09 TaxID=3075394 RepID=UPI002AD462FB|nr:hypothetical protein [Nostoc sp. DedQUE09]MDZ7953284.1 hypothetical protein [Nostoc sp. DedQUE09]
MVKNQLKDTLNLRRKELIKNIQILSEQKTNILDAIAQSCYFIEQNICRTESDMKIVTKEFVSNLNKRRMIEYSSEEVEQFQKLSMQSIALEASELIPEEFGHLNDPNYLMDEFGNRIETFDDFFIQNEYNLKLFTFIYHQFFITIIATLDDYFSQFLLLILQAYPEKVESKKISINYNDVFNFLELGENENIVELIDSQITNHVRTLMHGKPLAYLNNLVSYLEDEKLIRLEKLTYCEMCLRRNAGVHSGWVGNQEYNHKIEELKKVDTGNQLKFSSNETNFLGLDIDYFKESSETCKQIINTLKEYCENKFQQ